MSRCDVRFTPKSGHYRAIVRCPLCAKSGLMHFSKMKSFDHDSITSSAWVNVDPALPVDARQRLNTNWHNSLKRIDVNVLANQIQEKGVKSFVKSSNGLMSGIDFKCAVLQQAS